MVKQEYIANNETEAEVDEKAQVLAGALVEKAQALADTLVELFVAEWVPTCRMGS